MYVEEKPTWCQHIKILLLVCSIPILIPFALPLGVIYVVLYIIWLVLKGFGACLKEIGLIFSNYFQTYSPIVLETYTEERAPLLRSDEARKPILDPVLTPSTETTIQVVSAV
jgi:hypothetical protein